MVSAMSKLPTDDSNIPSRPGTPITSRMEYVWRRKKASVPIEHGMTFEETFGSVQPLRQPEDFKKLRELAWDDKVKRERDKSFWLLIS